MSPRVNLLPSSYRRAAARRRRIRVGAAIAAIALSAELLAGLTLHARAGQTRELADSAASARAASDAVRQKMNAPTGELALLDQQLKLARKLRTTHRWSRLLGTLAQTASSHITLTAVSTDPPRWAPGLGAEETVTASAKSAPPAQGLLAGLSVRGCAADYEELTRFVGHLQAAGAFASLELREARRGEYLNQDVILFELQGRW